MPVIDISQFENTVVIHFETDDKRINAYTLASTLVCLADAAKAANSTLNAGYEIEIVVEALGPGSFRALIRAIYTSSRNLFGSQVVLGVILGVMTNYIYERTLALDNKVVVEIKTDEVIVQRGADRVVVPRNVYEATRKAEKNPHFVKAMSQAFDALASDEKITGLGFVTSLDSSRPEIPIPKAALQCLAATEVTDDPDARIVKEQAEIQIIKAILDKSRRKWEFMWRGVKISAPVTDEQFYAEFFAHNITIAPGDTLQVTLAMRQTRDADTGIYSNTGYEVVEVHAHVPRIKQRSLSFPNSD